MFRSKLLVLFILFPLVLFSIDASAKAKKKRAPKTYTGWEIGGSYMMWNEPIYATRGGTVSRGVANYGGFAFGAEKHWRRQRMLYAIIGMIARGKAAAGEFSTGTNFNDAANRAWRGLHVTLSANYQFSPSFYFGAGLLGRYRTIDWSSSDQLLSVEPVDATHLTGLLILRWEIARSVQMTQSFAPLDLKGATYWQWAFMFRL